VAFGATSAFRASSGDLVERQGDHPGLLLLAQPRLAGARRCRWFGGLGLKARAFPRAVVVQHHRRHPPRPSDLRHDPSFHGEASGGLGVQADGGLTYQVWRGLSVEVGYQYWRVKSGEGTETASFTSGDVDTRLLENRTERYGPYVGVRYRSERPRS